MTIDKIRLKALFAEGLGRDLEKDLESAQISVYKWQGATEALLQSAKIISDKCRALKDRLLSGDIQLDASDPLAAAKFVVAQIQAIAVATLHEHADTAKKSAITAAGKCDGLEFSLKKVKAMFDEERTKLENIVKAVKAGDVCVESDGSLQTLGADRRLPGTHPGPTLKQQRQGDAESKQQQAEVVPISDDTNPGDHGMVHLDGFAEPQLSQNTIASTAAPKRRGRRRKGEGDATNG